MIFTIAEPLLIDNLKNSEPGDGQSAMFQTHFHVTYMKMFSSTATSVCKKSTLAETLS